MNAVAVNGWQPVIGLEIHTQLATKSKIFSPSSAAYCESPNRHVREVDGGMPGALPVLNRVAVTYAIRLGLALSSDICLRSEFARKNYFYPDLPKGYQISQFEHPIISGGALAIECDGKEKIIGITRAHLEEDAGKLTHQANRAAVDLNRAGAPLLEIVSEPDMMSIAEAAAYAKTMYQLVCWLAICDGNMQEGSYRMDANISVHRPGTPLGTRCEIKNLNSFRFLEQALEYEITRQINVIEEGGSIIQQTRLFDANQRVTRAMRSKEDAHDYRYFPDPDLPPLHIDNAWIENIKSQMPELPSARRQRFINDLGLSVYDANVLTARRDLADYFESTLQQLPSENEKLCANWVCGELSALLNKHNLSPPMAKVTAANLAELLKHIIAQTISATAAKGVLEKMWECGDTASVIIEREGLAQIDDEAALEKMADDIIAAHPAQVAQLKDGKEKLLGFFVGQIMKVSKGRANPAQANAVLRRKLGLE